MVLLGLKKNIIIEAGTIESWGSIMKDNDMFIGLQDFGTSGPGKDVYNHFEITLYSHSDLVLDGHLHPMCRKIKTYHLIHLY